MSDYPEHDKLAKISDKSQVIGEFLDWLRTEREIVLAKHGDGDETFENRLYPTWDRPADLLADFFEIDLKVIETEKRAMLAKLREAQE